MGDTNSLAFASLFLVCVLLLSGLVIGGLFPEKPKPPPPTDYVDDQNW